MEKNIRILQVARRRLHEHVNKQCTRITAYQLRGETDKVDDILTRYEYLLNRYLYVAIKRMDELYGRLDIDRFRLEYEKIREEVKYYTL